MAADPDRFSDVTIVIGKTPTTQPVRDQVRTVVKAEHRKEAKTIDALPDDGMFITWEKPDLNRWRRTFVELWMPGKRISV
jgi:hypothetical protein